MLDIIIKTIKEQKPETTSQLIELIQKTTNLQENEILNLLNQLETNTKIHYYMKPDTSSNSFTTFLFSIECACYWIIITLVLVSTFAVFTIPQDWYPLFYVRNILGVIFVLFLPGYTFIKVFFPAKVPNKTFSEPLANIERVALSVGISIALTSIVGLILYFSPIGIGVNQITLSILALTTIFATTAMIREYNAKTITIQNTI
jgi:uncharacterized membrane protein